MLGETTSKPRKSPRGILSAARCSEHGWRRARVLGWGRGLATVDETQQGLHLEPQDGVENLGRYTVPTGCGWSTIVGGGLRKKNEAAGRLQNSREQVNGKGTPRGGRKRKWWRTELSTHRVGNRGRTAGRRWAESGGAVASVSKNSVRQSLAREKRTDEGPRSERSHEDWSAQRRFGGAAWPESWRSVLSRGRRQTSMLTDKWAQKGFPISLKSRNLLLQTKYQKQIYRDRKIMNIGKIRELFKTNNFCFG